MSIGREDSAKALISAASWVEVETLKQCPNTSDFGKSHANLVTSQIQLLAKLPARGILGSNRVDGQ